MSLCLLRTLLPRVMTVTEARRGLILLPIKCSCSAHAYNRGSIPTPIPDLPGIGGPSPSPSPIRRGSGVHSHPHPRFAGDRGSTPIPIPDLPESGIQLSTIEYCKGVEFRLPPCLTLRLIVQPIQLVNLRRPAMSDDAVDYGGTSDSDSESDKVPSRPQCDSRSARNPVATELGPAWCFMVC